MEVFPEPIEFRLVDINPAAFRLCLEWGEASNRIRGRRDVFRGFTDRRQALPGSDAVIITITTGGVDADERDIRIAEKYRVYPTVGDSTGPTGWSRALRNVPVFVGFARDIQELCPDALVANYTNPMAHLTLALCLSCANPTVGLCHAYHQTKRFIKQIFKLDTWDSIALSIAGVNHCHWVINFTVGREKGYPKLRAIIGDGSLADLLPGFGEFTTDDRGKVSVYGSNRFTAALYEAYGHLPYIGARHTAEFFPFTLSGDVERYLKDNHKGMQYDVCRYCDIIRTSIAYRRIDLANRESGIRQMIAGERPLPKRSVEGETVAEMIRAYIANVPFTDGINTINRGQVPQLPTGCCLETMGTIDGLGVHPFLVDAIPEPLLETMRPPALAHMWTTQGIINRDRDLLVHALHRDPLCAHLKPDEVRAMAAEFLESNREYFRL
jgi:alpha-galactosidase